MEVKSMEVKKTHPTVVSQTKNPKAVGKDLWEFLGDVKTEIRRISWTDPKELKTYTQIVIAATFLFGMGIFCIDLMIQGVLNLLSMVVRFIVG